MNNYLSYVPEPKPVKSDYYVACHYYPGWKMGAADIHNGFEDLRDYPERTPIIGYYDEADPIVMDWQIKWALEHGINCFIHCWYRYASNRGKPVTLKDLRFAHAIHEAYFNCRYRDMMDFAIMWECSERWGAASEISDITDNLIPFWVENYFSKPTYQKIDGKPVLYIYSLGDLINQLGGNEKFKEAMTAMRKTIKKYGFPDIMIGCMDNGWNKTNIPYFAEHKVEDFSVTDELVSLGFDFGYQYCWHFNNGLLTKEQKDAYLSMEKPMLPGDIIVDYQVECIKNRIEKYPEFFMYAASVMWSRGPWHKVFGINPRVDIWEWELTPEQWKRLLTEVKALTDSLPEGNIGRKFFVLDNWNEWSEGHYLFPNYKHGFRHLQAFREVFTKCDNIPDYRIFNVEGTREYKAPCNG
ncbi:MAG: glycoside hydrolase family 99-like domain-containing protein [Clostridia bacterium]|nr:glycoside hydrolase family 99-like domain-containing protein [Clostridia bacterium]